MKLRSAVVLSLLLLLSMAFGAMVVFAADTTAPLSTGDFSAFAGNVGEWQILADRRRCEARSGR